MQLYKLTGKRSGSRVCVHSLRRRTASEIVLSNSCSVSDMKYKSQLYETVLIEQSNGNRLVFQLKRVANRPRWVVIGVNLPSCAERALLQNCCTDYILL